MSKMFTRLDCLHDMYNGTLKQIVSDEVNLQIISRQKLTTAPGGQYDALVKDELVRKGRLKQMKVGMATVLGFIGEEEASIIKNKERKHETISADKPGTD